MNLSTQVSEDTTTPKTVPETPKEKKHADLAFLKIVILSLFLTCVVELLNHKILVNGLSSFLEFVTENPLAFLVNWAMILITLAPAVLVRRRLFWCTLVSAIWLIGGFVNGFILMNRMTPFTVQDLGILQTGLDTLPNYLSTKYIVLLAVSLVVLIAALIFLFWKGPRCQESFARRGRAGLIVLLLSFGALTGSWNYAFRIGSLSETFPNLAVAYEDYGFAYCFLQTWLNKGIKRPDLYSEGIVQSLRQPIPHTDPQTDVNVIYVQLESFIDPEDVKGLELSMDALPFWHELTENYSTGYLNVPVVGAGTANTECEVLTGMSTRMFGPGEYPYQTSLMDHTVETVAYDLKENGYGTHAIHNHRAAFYNRNHTYANLGFDDFTALEFMPKVQKTPKNWAKDYVLTSQILQAMDTTPDQPDLVFTVSVQGHGKYPSEPVLKDPKITVEACPDEDYHYGLEYFVNQINEMDEFVEQLVTALEKRGEKTVLVLYGDHLPALNLKDEDMGSGSIYNTTYVIWDNIGLPKIDMDLKAYQISSEVMKRLGISNGNMNRYHQFQQDDPNYLKGLHTLQYDVLYGENYIYDGEIPYETTDIKMGTAPIEMKSVVESNGKWYLAGDNFTSFCKVFIDGEMVKTSFKSSNLIQLKKKPETTDLSRYQIQVMDKHKEVLAVIDGPTQ